MAESEAKRSNLGLVWRILEVGGMIVLISAIPTAFVVYYSTKAQLDRASQKVVDLTGQLAVAEDHLKELSERIDKAKPIIARLEKSNPQQLGQVLDQLERPEVAHAMEFKVLDARIATMGKQIATVYACADWAYLDHLFDNNAYRFSEGLARFYQQTSLAKQLATGSVVETFPTCNETVGDLYWELQQHDDMQQRLHEAIRKGQVPPPGAILHK